MVTCSTSEDVEDPLRRRLWSKYTTFPQKSTHSSFRCYALVSYQDQRDQNAPIPIFTLMTMNALSLPKAWRHLIVSASRTSPFTATISFLMVTSLPLRNCLMWKVTMENAPVGPARLKQSTTLSHQTKPTTSLCLIQKSKVTGASSRLTPWTSHFALMEIGRMPQHNSLMPLSWKTAML